MKEEKKVKSDPHDHYDHLPKDVLNNEQDPDSFRDPLEVQKEKEQQQDKDKTKTTNRNEP